MNSNSETSPLPFISYASLWRKEHEAEQQAAYSELAEGKVQMIKFDQERSNSSKSTVDEIEKNRNNELNARRLSSNSTVDASKKSIHNELNAWRLSINSTVDERKKRIDNMIKSRRLLRVPRMRWTTTLHARFVHAVELLGGHERASATSILELMDVKDLTLAHVKSHLRMYRTVKETDILEKRDGYSQVSEDELTLRLCSHSVLLASEIDSHHLELDSEVRGKKTRREASPLTASEGLASNSTVTDLLTTSDVVYTYSSQSDSHDLESDSEVSDKKVRRDASPEHLEKVTPESAPLQKRQLKAERLSNAEERLLRQYGIVRQDAMVDCLIQHIGRSDTRKIGLYGKHESGKTIMAEALKEAAISRALFDTVICISVPPDRDGQKMEMDIAGRISFSLSKARGTDFYDLLTDAFKGIKVLLILFPINQSVKREMMEIPEPTWEKGSKIVFVTGSEQLCHEMAVDCTVSLDDLFSWEVFCQNVGEVIYSAEIQSIAREIVKMCSHNSHAIILVARALRNAYDISIWKYTLGELSLQPAIDEEDVEALMVNVLRLSIEHLKDDKSRKCLKHLVLGSKNLEIATESVLGQWIQDRVVDTYEEGQQVLKKLIDANLLEDCGNGEFVRFQDLDRRVLANLVYQPEETRYFLMRGGLMLTEPPDLEEWQNANEILLMHNELSHLPEEPMCYSLSTLFLQKNCKLRTIPSSFFNCMPALEVLNLSKTRIRSLPKSISQLVSLKRFFLNDCVLLRSIPPEIGMLKQLELFDFEGTRVMNLPKEIGDLGNLTCLGVSISGAATYGKSSKGLDTVIPLGVIFALPCLEELNLDVDPDAEWWEKCAEGIVKEVCSLKQLSSIKFYFPRLELLGLFNQLRKLMEHPSFTQFQFFVGSHANRIMNRVPSDVEFELEWWHRYLRYTNGVGVPIEIKETLQHADSLFLERHATIEKLSEFGIKVMEQLKCCVLGECNELEVLIDEADISHEEVGSKPTHCECICFGLLEYLYAYRMRSLRCIWKGSVQKGSLSSLKSLTLCQCPELTIVFTLEMLDNLNNLEEIKIEDCPAITSLISLESSRLTQLEPSIFLPKLKKLSLHYVPILCSISCGVRIAPNLEWLSFYDCPSLTFLSAEEIAGEHLKKIKGERNWWDDLEWNGRDRFDGIFVPIDTCDAL